MHVTAYERLGPHALAVRWRELLQEPDAPERCELDEFGEVQVNPPPSFKRQRIVAAVGRQLELLLGGESGSYALATSIGVRFPDVCWAKDFGELARAGGSDPLTTMPLICVEVVSPGNKRKDINERVAAYVEAGVEEVVLIEKDGRIRFFGAEGERADSRFAIKLTLP